MDPTEMDTFDVELGIFEFYVPQQTVAPAPSGRGKVVRIEWKKKTGRIMPKHATRIRPKQMTETRNWFLLDINDETQKTAILRARIRELRGENDRIAARKCQKLKDETGLPFEGYVDTLIDDLLASVK